MFPLISRVQLAADDDYKIRPWCLYYRSHTFFITSTVAIGLFTDLFLYGLMVPVLPYLLHDRLDIPLDQVQHHVSASLAAYAGASLTFAPLSGYIADKTKSRQRPYLCGLMALLLATILLYFAQTELMILIARILQGMSGVTVWTIGFALCLETVSPSKAGTTIGSMFSFANLAMTTAPTIGGVIYEKLGNEGILGISVGIITLDLIMRLFLIEKKFAHRYDSSIIDPMLSVSPEQQEGATNDENEPLLLSEHCSSDYHIPSELPGIIQEVPILYCLRNSRLWSALLITLIQALLFGSFDATVPLEGQSLFGFSSLEAGLLFTSLGVSCLVIGPIAGWLVDKYGVKTVSILGYSSLIPFLFSLRLVHAGDPNEPDGQKQIALFASLLGLCGVCMGATDIPAVVEAGTVINIYHKTNPDVFGELGPYGQLYGLNAMVFAAGLTIGPFLAGGLRSSIGYGNMNAVLAGICALTALLSYLCLGGMPVWLKEKKHSSDDGDEDVLT